MNKKLLGLVLGALFLTILALIAVVSREAKEVGADMWAGTATLSTSTPFLASDTVLCSGPGVLDSIVNVGMRTGQLWVINASSVNHSSFATTTALLAILDAGFGTTTSAIKYGVDDNGVGSRGLLVSYTGTGTTTITYRCGG